MADLIRWDIYEINSKNHQLTSRRVRGRLRKFALSKNINLLTENTEKGEPRVRFALFSGSDPEIINEFLKTMFPDIQIELVLKNIANPVLSKLKVNSTERYE